MPQHITWRTVLIVTLLYLALFLVVYTVTVFSKLCAVFGDGKLLHCL